MVFVFSLVYSASALFFFLSAEPHADNVMIVKTINAVFTIFTFLLPWIVIGGGNLPTHHKTHTSVLYSALALVDLTWVKFAESLPRLYKLYLFRLKFKLE